MTLNPVARSFSPLNKGITTEKRRFKTGKLRLTAENLRLSAENHYPTKQECRETQGSRHSSIIYIRDT